MVSRARKQDACTAANLARNESGHDKEKMHALPPPLRALCSADEMRRYGVRTILDLRRMDRPCKKAAANVHEARLRRLGTIISKVCSSCGSGSARVPAPNRFAPHVSFPYAARALCVHRRLGYLLGTFLQGSMQKREVYRRCRSTVGQCKLGSLNLLLSAHLDFIFN